MRTKYNWNLIIDYINGNDIDNYDVEKLENDVDFMIQVIDYTNDKNMYKLCGDTVLNDYRFIKYLVSKFKDDIPFISNVADNFLDNHVDDEINYDCVELNFIMSDYVDAKDDFEHLRYVIYKNSFYQGIMSELSIALTKITNHENDLGLGFLVVCEMFLGRKEILDFFADQFIYSILYEDAEKTFEKRVHDNVKDFDDVKKIGLRNYLINFLRKYDDSLADYVSKYVYLLNDGVKSLKRIEKNWDNYVFRDNLRKFNILEQEIFDYFAVEDEFLPSFSACDLIDYIIKKMGLVDSYRKCFGKSSFDDLEDGSINISEDKLSLIDFKYYKFGFNLANELFRKNIMDKSDNDFDKKSSDVSMCKVIKFDFEGKKRTD